MFSIRTVNLIWQIKHRGIYTPSPFALDDAGTLALATPRPLEPRWYDFTQHKLDGGVEVRWGFSAETLIKMEVSHSDDGIGMTSDDLYLFRNRNKTRFLTDKHINYIDAALSADGSRVAAAFSDLAGASFAVAYGDISGRLIWLEEFDTPVSVTSISRDGTRVAIGLESGALTLLDQERRAMWTFELESAVRAVACSSNADRVAYSLEGGGVGLIGGDGARLWEATVPGDGVAMALSGDGRLCALLATQPCDPAGAVTIHCIMQDGAEGWQHDTERKSTGVSLSPDGCYMAVGARDGTISLFGIVEGAETAGSAANSTEIVMAHARNLMEANRPAEACAALKAAMAANAVDLTLYEEYVNLKDAWHTSAVEQGKQAMANGDARVAIGAFAAMLDEDPLCTQAAVLLTNAREMRSTQLIETAQRQESANDVGGAEASLREAAAVAPPGVIEPRRALAAFLQRRAAIYEALAEKMIGDGNTHAALDALTKAQSTCPSPERAARILRLQTDVEFEAGMQAYNAKQYVQAVFQFKKVLRLDKNHADAQRHLEFAKRFSQESSTDSLQDRFSRLE